MYLGEIVELGNIGEVIAHPSHPYTRALVQAVPVPDPSYRRDKNLPLKSMQLGSLEERGEGCSFYNRCLYCTTRCLEKQEYTTSESAQVLCCNLSTILKKENK